MVFSLFCFHPATCNLVIVLILLGPCLMCTWLNCWPTVHNADHLKWTLYLNIAHDVFEKKYKVKVTMYEWSVPVYVCFTVYQFVLSCVRIVLIIKLFIVMI